MNFNDLIHAGNCPGCKYNLQLHTNASVFAQQTIVILIILILIS